VRGFIGGSGEPLLHGRSGGGGEVGANMRREVGLEVEGGPDRWAPPVSGGKERGGLPLRVLPRWAVVCLQVWAGMAP
jgi:hypothetical protein